VRSIDHSPEYVLDYAAKALRGRRVGYDDAVVVLPRAASEVR
jgi:hypothetical protein